MKDVRNVLGFAALVWVLGGCNAEKKPISSPPPRAQPAAAVTLTGTQWILEEIGGKPVIANSSATLTFPEPGRAGGNGSCNRFNGSAEISGDSIKFGPMAATRMMCDPDASGQETEYLKALEGAQHFLVRDGKLLLYVSGMDKPLQFGPALK